MIGRALAIRALGLYLPTLLATALGWWRLRTPTPRQIAALLAGTMAAKAALRLLAVKAVIWSVALGSGTSGGVLAPLLIMGGALGALFGLVAPAGDPSLWALLGMAAMMGGTMRSPLTAIVFAMVTTIPTIS